MTAAIPVYIYPAICQFPNGIIHARVHTVTKLAIRLFYAIRSPTKKGFVVIGTAERIYETAKSVHHFISVVHT